MKINLDIGSRLKHGFNAFVNNKSMTYTGYGGYGRRPDKRRLSVGTERTTLASICTRIALDVTSFDIHHVKLDDNERYQETIYSGIDNCLNLEANIDQTGKAFIQDIIMSLLDEGVIAVIPIDWKEDVDFITTFGIQTMRTARILKWFPDSILVSVYNDKTGRHEEITVLKRNACIIENPFYSVMNETNSTMQRLKRKLTLLDSVDEQTSSGKLDLIVQLPYAIKTEFQKQKAAERRKSLEEQLEGSQYGIGYVDASEKIVQLNRSLDNNLLKQVEYLTDMLFSQLFMTREILNGTADEKVMKNYYSRTIEPFLDCITCEFKRKFLTKTARSQKHTFMYFRDPFKLVTTSDAAELADKFTRNEIMTGNEVRQGIGMKPSNDPTADELRNKNLNATSNSELNGDPNGDINDSPMDMPLNQFTDE